MKRWTLTVDRQWTVDAPDDFDADVVFKRSVYEFLNVDLRDYVGIIQEDEAMLLYGGADLTLEGPQR